MVDYFNRSIVFAEVFTAIILILPFANFPMFRLEGTEHMDQVYHQKWEKIIL